MKIRCLKVLMSLFIYQRAVTGSWKGGTHHRPAPSCSVGSLYRGQPTIYMLLETWHQTGQVSSASQAHFPPPQVQSSQCDSNS